MIEHNFTSLAIVWSSLIVFFISFAAFKPDLKRFYMSKLGLDKLSSLHNALVVLITLQLAAVETYIQVRLLSGHPLLLISFTVCDCLIFVYLILPGPQTFLRYRRRLLSWLADVFQRLSENEQAFRVHGPSRFPWTEVNMNTIGRVPLRTSKVWIPRFLWPRASGNVSTQDADDTCTVCLAKYKAGNSVSILPCGHFFHSSCISRWFGQSLTCVVCRQELYFKLSLSQPVSN